MLTQWIGTGKDLLGDHTGDDRVPRPKLYEVDLDDTVDILLCTDGLYNSMDEEEIYERLTGSGSIGTILDEMIEDAERGGETDNISAVLYRRVS